MKTKTENIPQMEDGELFRTILEASFTSMGEILGQMAAWAEPYFPLGAVEAVWLQALLAILLPTVCWYYRHNLAHFGAPMKRADSEAATTDATATIGSGKTGTVASRAGELSLNLAGTLAGDYALISAFIGVLNVYSWTLLAIGG